MKRLLITLVVVVATAGTGSTASAGDWFFNFLPSFDHHYPGEHREVHRDLRHNEGHRQFSHDRAHDFPITPWEHRDVHRDLRHDRTHDRVDHVEFHDDHDFLPRIGFGYHGRRGSFFLDF